MEGKVLHFDKLTNAGVIRTENGERFDFTAADWKSGGAPHTGAKVDFVAQGNAAADIYATASVDLSAISGNVSEKLSHLQGSDLGQKVTALFSHSSHNKLGLWAALVVLLSLFFPALYLPNFEIDGLTSISLIGTGAGKFLLLLLVLSAIFFHGGATRLYTRLLVAVLLGTLFLLYYDLFSEIHQGVRDIRGVNRLFGPFGKSSEELPSTFNFIRWGFLVNILAVIALFWAAFISKYTNNEKTI